MKKTITVILSFIMCFLACASVNAENAFITLNAVKSEDLITLTISADKAFSVASIEVKYDETKLIFDSSVFSDDLASASVMINPDYSENSLKFSVIASECILPESICTINFKQMKYASGIARFGVKNVAMGDLEEYSVSSEEIEIVIDDNTSGKSRNVGGNVSKSIDEQVLPKQDLSETKITNFSKINRFVDIKENDWFYDSVCYVYDNKLMQGISDSIFAPNLSVTRAMFVTVLYRMEGEPMFMSINPFSDVSYGEYYEKAVAWANAMGIVKGVSDTEFAPDNSITREQIATILYRYAKYKDVDVISVIENINTISYNDIFEVADWANEAMHYCTAVGIIGGDDKGNINPRNNATRAELAIILQRVEKHM